MEKHDVVVAGAGLAGMSFAYHYQPDALVLEKESQVGGLVRTTHFNGCRFDMASHLLHIRVPYIKELVYGKLGLTGKYHARKSHIYYDNVVIPYPFELNLLSLSEKTKQDCLEGLKDVKHFTKEEEDEIRKGPYYDYVMKSFGAGIGNHYLLPYNRKIWDTDPKEMSTEFMSFIPTADKDQIIKNATEPNSDKFGYNTEFFYPEEGIQEFADVFGNQLPNIRLNTEIKFIDTKNKTIELTDGSKVGYNKLVSTLPLNFLIANSDREDLKKYYEKLIYTTVYTVNIVIDGKVPDSHWIYFPQEEYDFYRICFPKNYFDKCTPGKQQIIAVEVGSRNHSMDYAEIEKRVVEQVKSMSIFEIEKIHFVHCIKIPVAYCIYDFERTKLADMLVKEFEKNDIYSIGRYGNWEYSAMQDAIMYGKNLSDKLKNQ